MRYILIGIFVVLTGCDDRPTARLTRYKPRPDNIFIKDMTVGEKRFIRIINICPDGRVSLFPKAEAYTKQRYADDLIVERVAESDFILYTNARKTEDLDADTDSSCLAGNPYMFSVSKVVE